MKRRDLLRGGAGAIVGLFAGGAKLLASVRPPEPDRVVAEPEPSDGYVRLPGTSGNYASIPDSAALDITGDIEVRGGIDLSGHVRQITDDEIDQLTYGETTPWAATIDLTDASTDGWL